MNPQVSDPVQHADGMQKYTSYRVDVRPLVDGNMQDVNLHPSAVLRRYSDFLWLFDKLQQERSGAIVPPLPEKQPVGRFSPAFVEDRRRQLERFLRRVAVHPELADAPSLDTFLRADDMTFSAAKNAKGGVSLASSQTNFMNHNNNHMMMMNQAAGGPSPKKDGFKRWFAEAKTSMTGDLVRSPDDDLFDEIQRYVTGLDNQMRNVAHQTTGLVRKGKEVSNGLYEFGLAFNLLGQSEADALGDALKRMGDTADRLSVVSAEHAQQEMAKFEEPIQDYIKLIHSVKLALHRRHEKRLTYSACLAEIEAKQSQLGKLRAQIGQEAKAYATEMSLRKAQENAEIARGDFAATSQRVLREVDRFKREKAEDMRQTVLDYITLQVEYNRQMEQIWATLIPQLEKVQLGTEPPSPQPGTNYANAPPAAPVAHFSPAPIEAPGYGAPYRQQPQVPLPNSNVVPPMGDPTSSISVQYRDDRHITGM